MTTLTPEGRRIVDEIAQRYYVSSDAAVTLLNAIAAGGGTQAQFSHYDLGGMGQWSRGGMIMIGDMFNNGLKAKVDGLCNELSDLLGRSGMTAPTSYQSQSQSGGGSYSSSNMNGGVSLFVAGGSGNWWPSELGHAASVGSQNDLRYAYFPQTRKLAINVGGKVTVYESGDHQIGGFSQQQGGDQSLTFTSQYGLVRVADLPVVGANPPPQVEAPFEKPVETTERFAEPAFFSNPSPPQAQVAPAYASVQSSEDDIFAKIERIADLHKKGILSQSEFDAKKAELLSRI